MAFTSIRCPVLGSNVTRVTDFEGAVTGIICPEYDEKDGSCRLRKAASEGGPLSQLLERMAEDTLETRTSTCVMRAA